MSAGSHTDAEAQFKAETARFREVLAKGRSAKQIELFDYLVEHSGDDRSPKEIEVAIALLGNQAALESNADSGMRVYVHRLRKRLEDYYDDRPGPRLTIPKGEYRVVLEDSEASYQAMGIARTFLANPALGSGIALFVFAIILYIAWISWPTTQAPTLTQQNDRQGLLGTSGGLFDPVILVGDTMLLAESKDQRSIQRMVQKPEIQTRDQFGEFLKENPETFYQFYDFNLRFSSITTLETAWAIQTRLTSPLGKKPAEAALVPVSTVEPEVLRMHDVIYIGRLSQLGMLEPIVFARSKLKLAAYDRLEDTETGDAYTAQVYTERPSSRGQDYGYVSVRESPNGRRLILLAGLGDRGTAAMAGLLDNPQEIALLKSKLSGARNFEALFEVQSLTGQSLQRRLVTAYPVP